MVAGPGGRERAGSSLPVRVGLLVALGGILLDQATKELAEALLERGEFVGLIGESVGWQLVYNPGGAFGMPAPPWVFLVVTVLVIAIVVRTLPATESLLQATAYGLLLAGAIGNVLDRLLRPGDDGLMGGHVVDFVAWGWWPRFNVADACITVGFALLLVALVGQELADRRREPGEDGAGDGDHADPRDGQVSRGGPGEDGTGRGRP